MVSKSGCYAILLALCAVFCSSCGPHMYMQQSIKPFSRSMPPMPAGTVPTRGTLGTLTVQQSRLSSPLKATTENLYLGRIYYGYYCIQCHGDTGDGNGPVGQSYIPRPTDLTSGAVKGLPDGELYLRMLTGVGHDPVMSQTVLPEHRWSIVLYVRQFKAVQKKGGR